MKKFLFPLLFCTAALLSAGGKADWISTIDSDYPSSQYITGLGTGPTVQLAEASAKMSLSQQLGESIRGEQKSSLTATKKTEDGSLSISLDERILFQKITGIQIKKSGTKDGLTYALAVLPRKEAGDFYYTKISESDSVTAQYLSSASKESDSLRRLGFMRKALAEAKENEYNLELLSVINPQKYKMVHLSYKNTAAVQFLYDTTAFSVSFYLNTTGEHKQAVEEGITQLLNDYGFSVVTDWKSAAYIFDSDITTSQSSDGRFEYERYSVNSTILLASNERLVTKMSLAGREGHNTYEQARQRTDTKLPGKIRDEYAKQFQELID